MKPTALILFLICFTVSISSGQKKLKVPTIDFTKLVANPNLISVPMGKVSITSGKVVVMDALAPSEGVAFDKTINPGVYEVELLMWPYSDYYVVAFARMKIKNDNIKLWELALPEGLTAKQLKTLKKDTYFGFNVESELASISDKETVDAYMVEMKAFWAKSADKNFYTDFLAKEFAKYSGKNKYSLNVGDWNVHKVKKSKEIAMFATGYGKGYYPSYWGLNDAGEISELIVDFMVVTKDTK